MLYTKNALRGASNRNLAWALDGYKHSSGVEICDYVDFQITQITEFKAASAAKTKHREKTMKPLKPLKMYDVIMISSSKHEASKMRK